MRSALEAVPVVGRLASADGCYGDPMAAYQGLPGEKAFWRSAKNDSVAELAPAGATRRIHRMSLCPFKVRW